MKAIAARYLGSPAERNRVLAIAVPAIVANSSAPLVGLVDTWAVGHLPGAEHLAAVGLGSVIFNYLLWAFGFLRMSTTGLVAQAVGRDDLLELGRLVWRSAAMAVGLGVAMIAFQSALLEISLRLMAPPEEVALITADYFRLRIGSAPAALLVFAVTGVLFGQGRSRAVLGLQLALNLGNAALNLLFVVGLGMGVPGVALGTLIATWLAAVLGAWLLARNPGWRTLRQAARDGLTWALSRFRRLVLINGFIFLRTIFLMTALALIMRESARFGETGMAASHVVNQYLMLIALGLDGFAHAAEALAGAAWGEGDRHAFRHWSRICGAWAVIASVLYGALFWLAGDAITASLTNLEAVRSTVGDLMPLVIALPIVSVWCYHFDGVFIGATAATAMAVTMGLSFAVYLALLGPFTDRWGLMGLWAAVLVFMAARGLAQGAWYPRLTRSLD